MQCLFIEGFANDEPAVRQAQMQQLRAAFCMGDFHRMLQEKHFRRRIERADPVTDAGGLRAQAAKAVRTFHLQIAEKRLASRSR
ncbi:hypothetical protein GCM10011430_19070 [Oxalicibacterium solurbis]|uniref:Uncharacterized protein n=1 Tax=Oxalicibacterium solurbis TaxID=69280 RepID=A0A8J3F6E1_9BURK|nr:hypothetical protein GCM10011430_19070 [Oxalicibacterium solurbis]